MNDRPVFNDKFAPITRSIGFLHADVEEVAKTLQDWQQELHSSVNVTALDGETFAQFHRLEPLEVGHASRHLVAATATPGWTAVFDSSALGTDPWSLVGYLTKRMGVIGAAITHDPSGTPANAARVFTMFGPLETEWLNEVRTVGVTQDGSRWNFQLDGTPQDFEVPEAYKARRIKDRFTLEMLVSYAQAIGLRPLEDSFYPGPCFLVETPTPPGIRTRTLAEVQADLRTKDIVDENRDKG